ncbi:MAG: crotonase/enoyl-CoA hydratase family protein [Myxococcota bacterium]
MTVRIDHHDRTTVVTLDRPGRRNAVDRDTASALVTAFRDFDADPERDVAILTGAGGTFCAGADLKAFSEGTPNRLEPDGDGPMGPSRLLVSKPVIAAVAGHAVAGGLELACWCDLRIVEADAVLGVFCRRWGVPLIDGGTVRLPRIIGLGRALDLMLTGRAVGADEALAIGLATRVVPSGTSLEAALELAVQLSGFPQVAMRADRLSAYRSFGTDLEPALASEFADGLPALQEGAAGALRFAKGAGRHGSFED